MSDEEIKQEIIAHLDAVAKMHPFCLLKDGRHYMMENGHVGAKDNIYEIDGRDACPY